MTVTLAILYVLPFVLYGLSARPGKAAQRLTVARIDPEDNW